MARQKVKLAYITNDAARKATFKKRGKGLMKKMTELSVLCGIQVCAIIYSQFDTNPIVWPSPSGAQQTIARFKQMSKKDQSKKMLNQESYIKQRLLQAKEQLKKQRMENLKKEIMIARGLLRKGLHNLSVVELNELRLLVETYVAGIEENTILFPKP